MEPNLILISPDQLSLLIETSVKKAITETFTEKKSKLLSRNEVRLILKIGYKTLNDLIENDKIQTTADKKYITEISLNKYLGNE